MVTLKNTPLFSTVIPSKIFEFMAMKVPVVIAVPEGEATNIVKAENSGLIVAPESPKKLAEAISKLKSDRDLHQELALNSHLAANKFNRKNLAAEMLKHLESVLP